MNVKTRCKGNWNSPPISEPFRSPLCVCELLRSSGDRSRLRWLCGRPAATLGLDFQYPGRFPGRYRFLSCPLSQRWIWEHRDLWECGICENVLPAQYSLGINQLHPQTVQEKPANRVSGTHVALESPVQLPWWNYSICQMKRPNRLGNPFESTINGWNCCNRLTYNRVAYTMTGK